MRKIKLNLNDLTLIIIALLSISLICSITLFIRPLIGMADNGDFYRIIGPNGLYHISNCSNDTFFGYFNKQYGIYKYFNETGFMILSTHSLMIQVAIILNKLLNSREIFDIRFLALIYIVVTDFAAYFILKSFLKEMSLKRYKFFAVILFVLIFCDTGYIAYFNSFYGEAVNFSFFLLSIGLLIYMYSFDKIKVSYLLIFSVVSLIFIGSKQQLAPVGIIYSLILFRLIITESSKSLKHALKFLIALFVICSAIFYFSIVGPFDYINRYHSMTRGVLIDEPGPEEILKEFNINPQYAMLAGNTFYNPIPVIQPEDDKLMKEFYSKYSFGSIIKYYLKNPAALGKMLSIASENGYSIRPTAMGNYEKIEGKAFGQKASFFTIYSYIKSRYLPHNIFFTMIVIVSYFFFSIKDYIYYLRTKDVKHQLIEEVFLAVFLIGISQVFVSILGAGDADLSKHLFMFNLSFDMLLYFSCIRIFNHIQNREKIKGKQGRINKFKLIIVMSILTIFFPYNQCNAAERKVMILYDSYKHFSSDYSNLNCLVKLAMEANNSDISIRRLPCELGDVDSYSKIIVLDNEDSGIVENTLYKLGNYKGKVVWLSNNQKKINKLKNDNPIKTMNIAIFNLDIDDYLSKSTILKELDQDKSRGNKRYLVLEKIYPFINLNEFKEKVDFLSTKNIPFICEVMPIYENIDFISMKKFTDSLIYAQNKGGAVVLHSPIFYISDPKGEEVIEKTQMAFSNYLKYKVYPVAVSIPDRWIYKDDYGSMLKLSNSILIEKDKKDNIIDFNMLSLNPYETAIEKVDIEDFIKDPINQISPIGITINSDISLVELKENIFSLSRGGIDFSDLRDVNLRIRLKDDEIRGSDHKIYLNGNLQYSRSVGE
ncbi:DUF2334 domain-containing protein [Clostridium manihotivorum]|uniref:Uncharacterized protein n=1 Tax=Clostridium manihotivorum TaxID=2320868 RepID=A0A3R5U3R3_9CLOT|nr:DUF2334 domain-containing protein [Clostridium manihotivorum]QAA30876.1 hypothetical protein C1I91_03915 [Clostridium manihotivorum]